MFASCLRSYAWYTYSLYLRREGHNECSKEETNNLKEREEEAMLQSIKWADDTINNFEGLLEDIDFEVIAWRTFVQKSDALHFLGEHVEAVRMAIRALQYSNSDSSLRELPKELITSKHNYSTYYAGYGIIGDSVDSIVEICKERDAFVYDNNKSDEDNERNWKLAAHSLIEDIDKTIHKRGKEWFSSRPYYSRQFIFTVRDLDHIGGCYDETDNIKYVFPIDELPRELTFPMGHPQPNTLYYAHPLRPAYLPFENAQLLLFYEKVHEMCRLFQCLGATHITARCLKGKKVSQEVISSNEFNAEGGYKITSASVGVSGKNSMSGNRENRDEMQLNQSFSPQKAPYCPDDLLWAKEDPELRTLIQQRLEGGLLEFTKKVSSYETSNLSQNQVNDVKAAFKSLMLNVSANYSASTDTTFSQTSETEWEISVQFKPLKEFDDYVSPKELKAIADARKGELLMEVSEYLWAKGKGLVILGTLQADIKAGEPVVVCTGDDEFDSSIEGIVMFFKKLDSGERGDNAGLVLTGATLTNVQPGTKIYRRMENDTRQNAHTSAKRSVTESNSLTQNEEKYKEEVLFCLEDNGIITDDDRRYLERKRIKFGISEERAKEIESLAVPSLTNDEKEYLETVKELVSSGSLTERARRLLERERQSLNISKDRALEIEKMATNN